MQELKLHRSIILMRLSCLYLKRHQKYQLMNNIVHGNSDLSTDSDPDDVEVSSSNSSEEIENSDTDDPSLDSPDETETNSYQEKTFSTQELNACMVIMTILVVISTHCMTSEAAKDILNLVLRKPLNS